MKTNNGFTLVELLTTVTIIGVTLAIAVPTFNSTITTNRLITTVNTFVAQLAFARSESVKRGLRVNVCPRNTAGTACSTEWANGSLSFVDVNSNNSLDTGDTILRVTNGISGGNTFTATTSGTITAVSVVGYVPSGESTGSVDFTVCSPSTHESRIITLSNVGHLSTATGTC